VEAGPDGTETVVLLARETPLPAGVDFRTQIRGLKAQTSVRYSCPVEMENGRILPKSHQTRSVDVGTPATLDDAVIQNQQRIAGAVQGQFSYQYSVSFPVCNAVATQ
jgi:hypothetical protein